MRKALVCLLMLWLLVPQVCAAEEPAAALRFGTDTPISAIYASYTMAEDAAEVAVTFADHVKNFAYANFVDGKLWIAVASVETIDLNEAVGWVTAKDAEGQSFAPTLELATLKFDGDAATRNLALDSVQTQRSGDTLHVTVRAGDPYQGSYLLTTAAYDAEGRLLDSEIRTVSFTERPETFSAALTGCGEAACVKAFFVTPEWKPVSATTVPAMGG